MKTVPLIAILTSLALPAIAAEKPASISLEVTPSETDNVFFPDEDKAFSVELTNPAKKAQTVELSMLMELDTGETKESTQRVELPASGTKSVAIPLDLDEPCFAAFTFTVDGKTDLQARTTVAVVRPPQLDDIDFEEAFYGTHIMTNAWTAKRVGIRFYRSLLYWKWTEPKQGEYDFSNNIRSTNNALEYGIGYVWTLEPKLPPWIDVEHIVLLNTPDALALFEAWVRAAVEALPKERIAIEINNEPDITMGRTKLVTREEAVAAAAKLLVVGYDIVKSIDPSIPVLGGGSSGSEAKPGGFAQLLLEDADFHLDYYSAHLYCNTRYVKPDGSVMWPDEYLDQMLEQNAKLAVEYTLEKTVWSTELGWAYPMDDVYLSTTTRDFAAITAQALVLLKTVDHVGKIAWFRGYQYSVGLNERGYDYSLFVQQGDRIRPTTGASAFATVSSLLEGSDTGKALKLGPAMQGYLFENKATGQAVAALWTKHYDTSLKESLPKAFTIIDHYGRELTHDEWKLSRAPSFLVVDLDQAQALRGFLEKANWRPEQPFIVTEIGANNVNEFRINIESLLLEDAKTTISIGGASVEQVIKPGDNVVLVSCKDGVISGDKLSVTLKLDGGDSSMEVPFHKPLLSAPYAPGASVSLDKGLTPAKEALLVNKVDQKENLFPPDPGIPWEGPEDLSITYGYAWNEKGLYAIYRVQDDRFITPENHGYWNFDSLQIALDPFTRGGRAGLQPGQRELGAYLGSDGETVVDQGFPKTESKPDVSAKVTPFEGGMVYEWFIPWQYLYAKSQGPGEGAVIAANFIVNDNDGSGRDCWMGLADGIGENKKPDVYPWLYLTK